MINWHVHPDNLHTVYPPESAPLGAISILKPDGTYINVNDCDAVNGAWVENPQKVAARLAAEQAAAQASQAASALKAEREARIRGVANVNTLPELKQVVADIVALLNL